MAVTVGGRDANGIWWAKAGDIVEHLTVPNTAPTPPPAMTYPAPNTNNFEVKQPCLRDYISLGKISKLNTIMKEGKLSS